MNAFEFYAPTHHILGEGVVSQVGERLAKAGWKKALIVYGQGSVVKSGLLDKVKGTLDEAGVAYVDLGGVRPNPEVTLVREGIDKARAEGVDCILAVGGGSAIDAAKAIGFGIPYDGDVWDFFCGKAKIEACLPIAVVLTIPATGSEASASCVISNDELKAKNGAASDLFRPTFAFLDPTLCYTLPPYQVAAGATDIISHVCERFFSGVGEVPVTDLIATGIVRTVIDAAPVVLDEPTNFNAWANLVWSGTLAHNDIAGCGRSFNPTARAGGWESHALEHAISAFNPEITHGAGLAVVMPAWMRYVWREDPNRFLLFGSEVFGIEPIEEGDEGYENEESAIEWAVEATIDELTAFFQSLGMPATFEEFGLTPDDIDPICDIVADAKGEEFGGFKKLNRADVKAIFETCF